MKVQGICVVALGLLALAPAAGAAPSALPLQAPKNIGVEPSTPQSAELSSRAATAEMNGNPQAALHLAERAIAAEPRDPWPHYDRAMALARVGQLDKALESFAAAEERYAASDRWGKSVAIYGRAHALDQAGRCEEARRAYAEYASLIREQDPGSAAMADRYAAECAPRRAAWAPAPATAPAPSR